MAQDRLLEALQRLTRLQAELLHQLRSRQPVGLERLRLAIGPVEREHQLAAQPLPQRVLADEPLELAHQVGVAAVLEVGFDPLLESRQAQLLEPRDLGLREALVGQVGECRPAPEGERLMELLGALARAAPGLMDEPLEAGQVGLLRPDVKHVSGRPGGEPVVAQLLAQSRDMHLEALGRRGRRLVAPQLVDQAVGGEHLIGVQQEEGQERARLDSAERERPALLNHFERAKEAEVHVGPLQVARPYHRTPGSAKGAVRAPPRAPSGGGP